MKTLLILLLILFIPSTLAISTDMKPVYQKSETMIIEISGNILEPIQLQDVQLKRKNVQVPWEYDVKRVGDKYFLWGIVPNEENNYTLHLKDIKTTIDGFSQDIDFSQNFSTSNETIAYNIKPGFIITQENQFEINTFLFEDFPESITVSFPEEHQIILQSGENEITFPTSSINTGFYTIQLGIYSVPASILKDSSQPPIQETELPDFRFFPKTIESIILISEDPHYPFQIINEGEIELTDIVFEFNPYLFIIQPEVIDSVPPKDIGYFNLTLKNKEEPISGIITARSGDFVTQLDVNISFTENLDEVQTPYLESDYEETQGYYCSELGGKACTADEVCSSKTVSSLDVSNCCLATCQQNSEETSYAWIGYLIAAILVIVIVIIGARYFKSRKFRKPPLETRLEKGKKKRRFPDFKAPVADINRPAYHQGG